MKVRAGSSNPRLAASIAHCLGVPIEPLSVGRFPDSETIVSCDQDVQGQDLYVIQSLSRPVNDTLAELLLSLNALRGAGRLTAVIPYYGYARQDASADLVARLLQTAGADQIITLDLHKENLHHFFNLPAVHLTPTDLFSTHIRNHFDTKSSLMIGSPDLGGIDRARRLALSLDVPLGVLDKRNRPNLPLIRTEFGDFLGKKCILVDDILDSGTTLCNAADAVMKAGAESVVAYVTHGVLSEGVLTRLHSSPLDKVFITDSIQINDKILESTVIDQLSIAPHMAEAIKKVARGWEVPRLFA